MNALSLAASAEQRPGEVVVIVRRPFASEVACERSLPQMSVMRALGTGLCDMFSRTVPVNVVLSPARASVGAAVMATASVIAARRMHV